MGLGKKGQEYRKAGLGQKRPRKARRNPSLPAAPSQADFTLGRPARRKVQKGSVRYTWPADHTDPQTPRSDPSDVQELVVKIANRDGGILSPSLKQRLAALDRAVALGQLNRKQFEVEARAVLQIRQGIPEELIRAEALIREDPGAFMAQVEQEARQREPPQRELHRDRYGYVRPTERHPDLPPPHDHADPSSRVYSPVYAAWLAKRPAAEQPAPAMAA